MATDATFLLRRMEEYRTSMDMHVRNLSQDFEQLDIRWQAFNSVYEGDAARQFRANWLRTKQRFEEYVSATNRIGRLLDDRIDALTKLTREEDLA